MNLSSNIKDKLITIFGVLAFIAGVILSVGQTPGISLPSQISIACSAIITVSVLVIGYLTGKTPAANVKTPDQVIEQNKPEPVK